MSTSQLYAVLKRLEREGAIAGRQIESSDAPPRIEYTVTAAGRRQLETWLNEPRPSTSIRCIRVEFLSRVYVASLLGIPLEGIIARQQAACVEQHERLLRERQQAASGVEALALDFVIGQLEAALSWLERCAQDLSALRRG